MDPALGPGEASQLQQLLTGKRGQQATEAAERRDERSQSAEAGLDLATGQGKHLLNLLVSGFGPRTERNKNLAK